jgi:HD-like signal output (HDOD) protein
MGTATSEQSRQLMRAVEQMRAFPVSVQNILALTSNVTSSPRELVEIVEKDPVITIKVLRVVNSAHYSLPRQIASIEHAVVLLGFNTIKNLALGVAAIGMLPPNSLAAFNGQRYIRHSLMTAEVARLLSRKIAGSDAHDYFIAGLLHDFGQILIAQGMPAPFKRAIEHSLWYGCSLHEALLSVTDIDSAEAGAMVLEQWHFPDTLIAAIAGQHQPGDTAADMTVCLHLANRISQELGADFGDAAQATVPESLVQQRLGCSWAELLEEIGPHRARLEELLQLSQL